MFYLCRRALDGVSVREDGVSVKIMEFLSGGWRFCLQDVILFKIAFISEGRGFYQDYGVTVKKMAFLSKGWLCCQKDGVSIKMMSFNQDFCVSVNRKAFMSRGCQLYETATFLLGEWRFCQEDEVSAERMMIFQEEYVLAQSMPFLMCR